MLGSFFRGFRSFVFSSSFFLIFPNFRKSLKSFKISHGHCLVDLCFCRSSLVEPSFRLGPPLRLSSPFLSSLGRVAALQKVFFLCFFCNIFFFHLFAFLSVSLHQQASGVACHHMMGNLGCGKSGGLDTKPLHSCAVLVAAGSPISSGFWGVSRRR